MVLFKTHKSKKSPVALPTTAFLTENFNTIVSDKEQFLSQDKTVSVTTDTNVSYCTKRGQ